MACCVVILPQDVAEDILSRLPVKSLQRFKCLSKSWDSLISTHHSFARLDLQRALQSPKSWSKKILLCSPPCPLLSLDCEYDEIGSSFAAEGAISKIDFPAKRSPDSMGQIRVVGSCNGLICLALHHEGKADMDFYLWNPSTRNNKNLPDPSCLVLDHKPLPTNIGDHCYGYAFGFGYDSFSDDYKVFFGLWLAEHGGGNLEPKEKVAIFSTRENCWRIVPQLPHICTTTTLFELNQMLPGSFVDGTLNWLVTTKYPNVSYTIVAFDLKTERFFELPIPNKFDCNPFNSVATLGILEGRLCLSVISVIYYSFSPLKLWVMNEYGVGQSWTRLVSASFEFNWLHHFPLFLSNDNQIILANGENRLIRIDAEGKKLEEYNICKCDQFHYDIGSKFSLEAIVYLESLIWPFVKGTFVKEQEECA